jgi:hypothetical protein
LDAFIEILLKAKLAHFPACEHAGSLRSSMKNGDRAVDRAGAAAHHS